LNSVIDKTIYYNIADLQLEMSLPQDTVESIILPNFEPFKAQFTDDKSITCRVYVSPTDLYFERRSAKLLSDISLVWNDRFTFFETDDFYYTLIQYSNDLNKHWKMRSTKDFSSNTIYCGPLGNSVNNFISWYSMVAFAQSSLLNKCILIHASVVVDKNFGFAFLGKSGTGKSTHSRLWLKHIEGMKLLNDDNPAIKISGDKVLVYGTPWSGKTPCYINEARLLKGIIRLNQAPYNKFEIQKNKEALFALLPSCSALRWNSNLYSSLINILIEVINSTPIGQLDCLPDEEAARLCYTKIYEL